MSGIVLAALCIRFSEEFLQVLKLHMFSFDIERCTDVPQYLAFD
jgi:hypothetical protein